MQSMSYKLSEMKVFEVFKSEKSLIKKRVSVTPSVVVIEDVFRGVVFGE